MIPASIRNLAVCGLLLSSLLGWPLSAEKGNVSLEVSTTAPITPFFAAVKSQPAQVHLRPENDSPEVGLMRTGATITVTACRPDCAAPHAWALLAPEGAIKLELLNTKPVHLETPTSPTAETSWYGRVGKSGIKVFREPRLNGPIVTHERLSREMAFLPNSDLRNGGWLERVEGGFVRASRVKTLTPSRFQGQVRPDLPLAFLVRDVPTSGDRQSVGLHRYDRIAVRKIDGRRVVTDSGSLPRSAVRIVTRHSPPSSIPTGAKWVIVDLAQQTLTAYEGESAVYATLISSGKDYKESETHVGLYQVEHKMDYSDMHGESDEPYDVDRVPYALYFHKNEALHGTYWHDRFGAPASHGCVNLSLADARWLFKWSPPHLPENWSTIDPKAAGLPSLWVLIKKTTGPRAISFREP
jgi:hypothetical protein